MTALVLSRRRVAQPQGAFGVARDNPLARGLVFLHVPTSFGRNLIDGQQASIINGTASVTAASHGMAATLSNASVEWDIAPLTYPFTLLTFSQGYSVADSPVFGIFNPSAQQGIYTTYESGALRVFSQSGFSSASFATAEDTQKPLAMVARGQSQTLRELFVDGILRGNNTSSSTATGMSKVGLSYRDTGSRFNANYTRKHMVAAVWNRALTDAEIAAVSANPWQLFAPLEQHILVDIAPVSQPSGGLVLRRRRVAQPQNGAGVDWAHPMARGLLGAFSAETFSDYTRHGTARRNPPFDANTVFPVTKFGRTRRHSSYFAYGIDTPSYPGVNISGYIGDATVLAIVVPGTTASETSVAEIGGGFGHTIRTGAGGVQGAISANFRGIGAIVSDSAVPAALQREPRVCVARNLQGVEQSLWIDGTKQAATLAGSATAFSGDQFGPSGTWRSPTILTYAWRRALTDAEIRAISESPWQLFKPIEQRITVQPAVLGAVTFYRPDTDELTIGWASTAPTLAEAIDEPTPDDADYITSPDVNSPTPARMALDSPMPAGSYTARFRARRTDTVGEARLVLLDSSNVQVGATAWQALTGTLAQYSLSVTTTGTATRFQIEVRA